MINRGFWIDNIHSVIDWDLVMSGKVIGQPEPKIETVSIDGGDGSIDLSTVLTYGDIKYHNRAITISVTLVNTDGDLDKMISKISNIIHGQIHTIVFDDDPEFYYKGRCRVSDPTITRGRVAEFQIIVDAQPYKMKILPTIMTTIVKDSQVVFYENLRKWVVPTFKSTGELQILFNDASYVVSEGEFTLPDIIFKPGTNVIKYVGNATVTVTYNEGAI